MILEDGPPFLFLLFFYAVRQRCILWKWEMVFCDWKQSRCRWPGVFSPCQKFIRMNKRVVYPWACRCRDDPSWFCKFGVNKKRNESLDDAAEFMHERMDLSIVETMSFMLISFAEIPGLGLFKTLSDKGCKHRSHAGFNFRQWHDGGGLMHFGTAAWLRDKLKMSVKTPASCSSHAPSASLGISSGIAA